MRRPRWLHGAWLLAGCTASVLSAVGSAQTAPSVDEVLRAARAYLEQYRADLATIVATERTVQRINRQVPIDPKTPRARTTTAEVHFKFVAGDGSWMAVRDVLTLDDAPLTNRPDIAAALKSDDTATVIRTFKAFNSQFNIGRLVRNFNEPMLALGVLDPNRDPTFRFSRKSVKVEGGITLVTIGFQETRNVTPFALDLQGRQADVRGELIVEAGSGRIRKTTLELALGHVRARLVTTFARNDKLDVWVPVTLAEFYEDGVEPRGTTGAGAQYEDIFCESTYSDFKRFTTTARIK